MQGVKAIDVIHSFVLIRILFLSWKHVKRKWRTDEEGRHYESHVSVLRCLFGDLKADLQYISNTVSTQIYSLMSVAHESQNFLLG